MPPKPAKKAAKKTRTIHVAGKKKVTRTRHQVACPVCGHPFPIDITTGGSGGGG